jgi:lipopolysaccharide export system protein LptC
MIGRANTLLFPLIVLGVLAFITFWIDRTVKLQVAKNDGLHRHDVDYFLENFVTTKTDIHGNLRHVLAAVEMRHFPDDESTELVRPRFTQYGENKPPTQIEGQLGYVSANGEVVKFKGNVIITRKAYANHNEMRVYTDHITIVPKDEKASTEAEVTIVQPPNTKVVAQGMSYNKATEELTLNSRVKGHYESPRTSTQVLPKKPTKDKVNKK